MKYKLQEYVEFCEINGYHPDVFLYKGQKQYIQLRDNRFIWYRDDECISEPVASHYGSFLCKQLLEFFDYKKQLKRQEKLNNLLK